MAESTQKLLIKLEATTAQMRREMRRAEKSVGGFERKTKKSLGGIAQNFKNLNRAAVGFGAIFAASLVAKGVKNIILTADSMGMLEDRIRSATRETGGFRDVWDGLLATSLKTGGSLNASVELFQRLAFTQKELGATNKDMVKLNDIIQKLGVISGATTEQLKNGTLQLSQGLGEGIFRAQEFNSVLENMPAVLNAIAKSMGKTVSGLRAAVKNGELLSKDVFAAILSQGQDVEKQFSEIPERVSRAWGKVMTALAAQTSDLNKELLVTDKIARGLVGISIAIAPKTKIEELNIELERAIVLVGLLKEDVRVNPKDDTLKRMLEDRLKIMRFINSEREKEFAKIASAKKSKKPEKPKPIEIPRATPDSIQPSFNDGINEGATRLREIKANSDETRKILAELEIDVLRATGKVAEAIRAEADAEITTFRERLSVGISTAKDLADFRILKNREVAAELKQIADKDLERLNKQAADFGNAMAAAFESRGIDAILNGDLSGALKGIAKDILAISLRLLVLKPLAESLFKSSSGGGTGGFIGSVLKSFLGGKAGGGDISGPTLVGERGPELFIPKTAGTIKNASDTRNMGGKTEIIQNISMSTDVKNTVRAEIAQSVPLIAQAVSQIMGQQFAGVKA